MNQTYLKWLLFIIYIGCSLTMVAQPGKVYKSLKDIKKPEDVYNLQLNHKRLKAFPAEVFTLPNLRVLDLGRNNISEIPSDIVKLQNLEELKLERNLIKAMPLEIGLLPEIKVIDINRNPIAELPDIIGYLNHLEKLILWGTGIEQLPESFEALDGSLQLLDMRACSLTRDDQEKISQMLPNVKKLWNQACNCR